MSPTKSNKSSPTLASNKEAPQLSTLSTELKKMEVEPLLPIEKKLILGSIGLGLFALGFLVWVSYTFFPSGH
jgi:hypothetical protein